MPSIIVTRLSAKPRERMRWCFDGATFRSCSLQELRGRSARWVNIRRWEPKDKPRIPRDVRAEVADKVRLSERRED